MKQVVIHVDEESYEGFLTFLKSLDFVQIENEAIPEWQQNEVAERKAAYEAGTLLSKKWKEAQRDIFKR